MISIVIPALNEEKVIGDTLLRLKETLSIPHEIIVSDGKSTDKTVEIARKYADTVVVHDKPHRQTIAEGRNAGANAAKGDYVAFLDADCRIENADEFFTEAMKEFSDDPKLVAQAGWIRVFPEVETRTDKVMWTLYDNLNWLLNRLNLGVAPGEFQMMSKETFKRVGGFREDLVTSEDNNMFNRLARLGKVRLNRELVVYHSGRHGHVLGWPKMLSVWFLNTLWYLVRGKSYSKEWEVIR